MELFLNLGPLYAGQGCLKTNHGDECIVEWSDVLEAFMEDGVAF